MKKLAEGLPSPQPFCGLFHVIYLHFYKVYAYILISFLIKQKTMPTTTISPDTLPPVDPWHHAVHTEINPRLQALPFMSPEQEAARFNGIIQDNTLRDMQNTVISHPAISEATGEPTDLTPHTPSHHAPERSFTPTPTAEIERRRLAGLQASFALAHTLRTSNPDLMRNLRQATTEPSAESAAERPANYRGTRRRLGRLARILNR